MQGVYALIIEVPKKVEITIGALGIAEFSQGIWIYIGSALGTTSTSLEKRISRHLSNNKKIHWHIDYLLTNDANILDVIWAETKNEEECNLAQRLKESRDFESGPPGFGASDCNSHCGTHIFRYQANEDIGPRLKSIFTDASLIAKSLDNLISE